MRPPTEGATLQHKNEECCAEQQARANTQYQFEAPIRSEYICQRHDKPLPLKAVYFTAVEIDPNVPLRLVPTPFTTLIIATEMPAAIRPYSIAVAPDSSARNARSFRRMLPALCAMPLRSNMPNDH